MLTDDRFLIAVAILIVLALLGLGVVFYFATRASAAKPGTDPKLIKLRFDSLRNSFRQAVELIEGNIAARSERYGIPWVLVLNEGMGQRNLPIEQSGVPSALSSEAASAATTQGISWHFFDKGVVVEMQGAYLGSPDDENAAEKPWDEFLGLCRNYRPQRPFDSVVITVPAEMLLDNSPDSTLEFVKLARLAHRRLWLAQNRFAMRFAVYVTVSGCEKIEGFSAFSRALPETMRAGMLGWSSPYDLSTTYQGSWIGEAMNSVVHTISDTTAELFASNKGAVDSSSFFLLPNRVDALRSQLQAYADELMRPSAYHEPFFFRGIYFTGDSSLAARTALAGEQDVAQEASDGIPDASDLVSQLMQEPAFLRDLFEKKIFLEYGLARPSRQQLTRPMLSRVARVAAVVLLGGWSIGLVVATVQLSNRNPDIAKMLKQIEVDNQYRNQMMSRGTAIPPEWYKAKTLALLSAIENLGAEKTWAVLMPGSWSYWNNLDTRVVERVEREFGEIAIGTLRRELYARASELTGVEQDESTSELIIGGFCMGPRVEQGATHVPTLAIESTPEFAAVQQYLSQVEQLEQAIGAMQRLQQADANSADDLRLLVKYTLGTELPGNISQSIRFFRGNEANASAGMAALSVNHIRHAVRCSLAKGMGTLDQRVFVNNDLLVLERQLAALTNRLLSTDSRPIGYAQAVAGYKEILSLMRSQESLLAAGRGEWMHKPSLELGTSYDKVMARITESDRLLGPEAADQVNQYANSEFVKFSAEFSSRFNAEGHSGIIWQDKESRFLLSPERLALRDAVTGLLAQPFMVATSDREIPEMPTLGILTWDTAKLDQALALVDEQKRFMNESLVKFPPEARPSVVTFVNDQFGRLGNDKVVAALGISGRVDPASATDAMTFEAARGRLAKLQGFFTELGFYRVADGIQQLLSQDAQARLRQLDSSLNQFDLYAIRGRDFSYWTGDQGPLLQALGVTDGQAMTQYLAQQFSRVETLGRQAEVYLNSLDKAAAEGQLATRWQAINREVERYRTKNANSSLNAYEQFLMTVGVDVDRYTCAEKLATKAPSKRPTDYFAIRHLQVYTALLKRCTDLRYTEQQELWSDFAYNFNRLLAGRPPFAVSNGKDLIDADFDDVGQLFRSSDKMARVLKTSPLDKQSLAHTQEMRRFSDQYERARVFMAPLYPVEDGVVAGYDIAAEFRVNQGAELDGNKVIDWALEIGPQTLRFRDPPRALRWEPGMPVTLTLRVAKDAPGNVFADPQQPYMSVDGKSVIYRFTDTWSLLRMIKSQREADTGARSDGRTQLLRMEFPMGTGTELGKSGQPDVRARVFLRFTLSAVGKRTPLAWPGTFPSRAPEFSKP
ncbi:type VI secretion system protein [Rhodoferax saidenbachensis]|uniref:Type VI secretion protein IcmF n=1 Tax=Rhodoferax saidenbachensis TaxID=1484693 RepID=A0A1P8KEE8_9BURK|nr:type VI secretion system protein [Rhodoferax saidenbachensis]APW44407.1 type VI secretion protein IcmF [Rhodoferax saidenbachensis]